MVFSQNLKIVFYKSIGKTIETIANFHQTIGKAMVYKIK
jgi:hypothetical protein